MKKKIISLCLVLMLALTAIGGATLAYFTDTKSQTNSFTAGKVQIKLDEAKVKKDDTTGNLVADGDNRTSEGQSYKLFPGMTVTKDPTITLLDGSEDSYIAAKITIKGDLLDLYGADTATPKTYYNLDITKFVSGGLIQTASTQSNNWNGLSMIYTDTAGNVYYQDATKGNQGTNSEWVIYVFVKDIQKAKTTVKLFETITVDENYNNAEMAKLSGATVTVNAFAVQAYGMTATEATDANDCFHAMKAAFASDFTIGTSTTATAE